MKWLKYVIICERENIFFYYNYLLVSLFQKLRDKYSQEIK